VWVRNKGREGGGEEINSSEVVPSQGEGGGGVCGDKIGTERRGGITPTFPWGEINLERLGKQNEGIDKNTVDMNTVKGGRHNEEISLYLKKLRGGGSMGGGSPHSFTEKKRGMGVKTGASSKEAQ